MPPDDVKEIRFIDEARIEFLPAVSYYEQIERRLGVQFRNLRGGQRVGRDAIVIVAVAHFRRKPGHWHGRRGDG